MQCIYDAEVAPELSNLGFEVFLLPSAEHRQVWHSAARLPDNAALQPGAHGGLDDDIIDGLLTEVRRVIGSAKFGVAIKVRTAKIMYTILTGFLPKGRKPVNIVGKCKCDICANFETSQS